MTDQLPQIVSYDVASYDRVLANLYAELSELCGLSFYERIEHFSHRFLGQPYIFSGALGEGLLGKFDQGPLYRFDGFDCVTYVNTVLALAMSYDAYKFKENMVRLNYHEGKLDYQSRHHFMELGWNAENAELGIVRDATVSIVDQAGAPIYEFAKANIDRPNWLRQRPLSAIKLLHAPQETQAEKLLEELHQIASDLTPGLSELPYLPLVKLFDVKGQSIPAIFNQIPAPSIVEIVRPNWDLTKEIGTHMNISHVGFVIRNEKNELLYRHASKIRKFVEEILLTDYLHEHITSPTIKGINVHAILNNSLL